STASPNAGAAPSSSVAMPSAGSAAARFTAGIGSVGARCCSGSPHAAKTRSATAPTRARRPPKGNRARAGASLSEERHVTVITFASRLVTTLSFSGPSDRLLRDVELVAGAVNGDEPPRLVGLVLERAAELHEVVVDRPRV